MASWEVKNSWAARTKQRKDWRHKTNTMWRRDNLPNCLWSMQIMKFFAKSMVFSLAGTLMLTHSFEGSVTLHCLTSLKKRDGTWDYNVATRLPATLMSRVCPKSPGHPLNKCHSVLMILDLIPRCFATESGLRCRRRNARNSASLRSANSPRGVALGPIFDL